jgi:DNA-binding NarL/FixJ family response regulator
MSTPAVILSIEDDKDIATLLAEDLAMRGFRVLTADDGTEGLRLILSERPDLVLCDIGMPGLSGFDILAQLTEIAPRCAYMPFIFLTAFTDRDSMIKARGLGADDFLTKPIDFELLEVVIRQRLDRTPRSAIWPAAAPLNAREIEIMTLAARGMTSAQISDFLQMSKRTVDFHADNARHKLGASTRIEAAIKAATQRFIDP